MGEELRDYDAELDKLCAEIRKGIDGLPKIKDATERQNKISFLQGRCNRAKQVFRSFKVEMRELSKVESEPWTKKSKEHSDTINKLIQDLTWAQSSGGAPPPEQNDADPDTMTTEQILKKANNIQQKDISSLDNAIATIEASKQVGAEIGQNLAKQTDQLRKVGEDIEEINVNLKMASKELRAFVRRTATDKLILAFICLIICGILFIIIWSAVGKAKNTNVPDAFKPNLTTSSTTTG